MAKNPFAVRKQTTVKREYNDVYPERKGLNKPEYLGSKPLDLAFQKLETLLDLTLEETSIQNLQTQLLDIGIEERVDTQPEVQRPQSSPDYVWVALKLMGLLLEIQLLSLQQSEDEKAKEIISISLHDIKTFGRLVNLILVFGIYPAISAFAIGIPLEKRRMNDFGKQIYKPLTVHKLPVEGNTYTERYAIHERLLLTVYRGFKQLFATKSDVSDLLMRGSGYLDFLVVALTLASAPYFNAATRKEVLDDFDDITAWGSTYELYLDYSVLVNTKSPGFFKLFVMSKLQLLPYQRPDGVLTLIEFVLGLRQGEETNVEKFDHVANVLLTKPKTVLTSTYFLLIGTQCYDLLVNINRPTIGSCVCHFIDRLFFKNQAVARDFLFKRIWNTMDPEPNVDKLVLVSEKDLNNNINVLILLINGGLNFEVVQAIFAPLFVALWSYYAFCKSHEKGFEVAQNILVGVFSTVDRQCGDELINLLGRNFAAEHQWTLRMGANNMVEIANTEASLGSTEKKTLELIERLDKQGEALMHLLSQLDDDLVRHLFVTTLARWLGDVKVIGELTVQIADMRLLEGIVNKFKDSLARTPLEILELVAKLLRNPIYEDQQDEADSDDEDELEVVPVVLELLSAIISETQPSALNGECREQLGHIQDYLPRDNRQAQALKVRISSLLEGEQPADSDHEQEKRQLTHAIANMNDPLVPVRAHGLYLLRQLVEKRSDVISVDFCVQLHLVQLRDTDPYIYLNVIKGLDSLLAWDTGNVLPILLKIYSSDKGEAEKEDDRKIERTEESDTGTITEGDLEEKLRIGEVLLRYVQLQNEALGGTTAQEICHGVLEVIRRTGGVTRDIRWRMSAMSILGICCRTKPLGIVGNLELALDCAIGVLELETTKNDAILRRAAVVLISDLVQGTSETDKVPFPSAYRSKVLDVLRYVLQHDKDILTSEQATSVLDYISELAQLAYTVE